MPEVEHWTPFPNSPLRANSPSRFLLVAGRLKAGVSISQAQSEVDSIAAQLQQEFPTTNKDWKIRVEPLGQFMAAGAGPALFTFQGAVAFVLLIACANVAGLLLAQGAGQQKELAVRSALGSSRWRIIHEEFSGPQQCATGHESRQSLNVPDSIPRNEYLPETGKITPAGSSEVHVTPKISLTSERIRQQLAAIPGVSNATVAGMPPLAGFARTVNFTIEGQPPGNTMGGCQIGEGMQVVTFVMRSTVPTEQVVHALRKAVDEVDSTQAIANVRTVNEWISLQLLGQRVYALLLGIFGGIAVLLAAVGIYGIMAHSVSNRTSEIGVRVALGASRGTILRLILRRGILLVGIGMTIGVAASMALTRVVRAILFGVRPTDPLTFILALLGLSAVALLACYLPARRALKIDPIIALRYE